MKKITFPIIIVLAFIIGLASGCSSDSATNTPAGQTANNAASPANSEVADKPDDEIPASVKSVFADAQSFTKQHKDLPAEKIAAIEKDTGGKVPDKDHHSYLAFATKDGKRTQIGAATVVKADGKEIIIIYESKNGMPTIKEVRAEGFAKEFLAQFIGKNHDTKIMFGEDIKSNGTDDATAKAFTDAVRIDVLTMEALYGSPHTH